MTLCSAIWLGGSTLSTAYSVFVQFKKSFSFKHFFYRLLHGLQGAWQHQADHGLGCAAIPVWLSKCTTCMCTISLWHVTGGFRPTRAEALALPACMHSFCSYSPYMACTDIAGSHCAGGLVSCRQPQELLWSCLHAMLHCRQSASKASIMEIRSSTWSGCCRWHRQCDGRSARVHCGELVWRLPHGPCSAVLEEDQSRQAE